LEDHFVAGMRQDHRATWGKLAPEALGTLIHLKISSSGDDTGFIDRSLVARGAKRLVAGRVPYLSAGSVLAESNLVATLSRRVAEAMVRASRSTLQVGELPVTSPRVRTSMVWPRRLDDVAAHRWLRELIVSVCRTR